MDRQSPLVLLVEDDPQIRRFLRASLDASAYRLVEAESGQEGLALAAGRAPDVVLLDLGLPDIDGLEVTKRLREWSDVPIVILSARGQDEDKVAALDAGADDYLTKPFSLPELLARLRVVLRRAARSPAGTDAVIVLGDLQIDLAGHVVTVGGQDIHLTPTEFKILALLAKHAGRVVTHRQILQDVWGKAYVQRTHYLRVQMHGLRHKLEPEPARPRHLMTEPGVGYRLRVE